MPDDTFTDLPKNLFDSFKERLGNPICCAFIISWFIVNWRLIVFLILSKLTAIQKIEIIDETYVSQWKNIWLPLLCCAAYLIIMPWMLACYKWFIGFATTLSQKFVNYHKGKQLENALPIAEKECTLALRRSGKTEIEELRKENLTLKDNYKSLQKEITELNEQHLVISKRDGNQRKTIDELTASNEVLLKKNKSIQQTEDELISENDRLKQENKTLAGDTIHYEKEKKILTSKLNKISSDLDNAIQANITLKQNNETLTKERTSLTGEKNELLSRLKKITVSYNDLSAQVQNLETESADTSKSKPAINKTNSSTNSKQKQAVPTEKTKRSAYSNSHGSMLKLGTSVLRGTINQPNISEATRMLGMVNQATPPGTSKILNLINKASPHSPSTVTDIINKATPAVPSVAYPPVDNIHPPLDRMWTTPVSKKSELDKFLSNTDTDPDLSEFLSDTDDDINEFLSDTDDDLFPNK